MSLGTNEQNAGSAPVGTVGNHKIDPVLIGILIGLAGGLFVGMMGTLIVLKQDQKIFTTAQAVPTSSNVMVGTPYISNECGSGMPRTIINNNYYGMPSFPYGYRMPTLPQQPMRPWMQHDDGTREAFQY